VVGIALVGRRGRLSAVTTRSITYGPWSARAETVTVTLTRKGKTMKTLKHVLFVLAFTLSLGLYAGLLFAQPTPGGSPGDPAIQQASCGPCSGSLSQECSAGTSCAGTINVKAKCMKACCYGTNDTTCGAKEDSLATDPGPAPTP
jgi:hypothetical protein